MGHVGQKGQKGQTTKAGKIVRIIIVVFVVFLIIALFSVFLFKEEETDDDSTTQSPAQFNHVLNEEVEYDGLKIKVYDGHFESSFCGIEESSHSGQILYIVDVKITNTTNKTKDFQTGTLFPSLVYTYTLIYDDDYSYNSSYKQYTNFLLAYSEIDPLQTIDASLCFIVPTALETNTDKELKLEFKKNKIADVDKIHYWIFRGVEE